MKLIKKIVDGKYQITAEAEHSIAADARNAKADAEAAQAAAETAQVAAETAEQNAQTAKSNAQLAEQNAQNAEQTALQHENKAESWAEETEDVEVEPGKYSALHHSAKANAQRQLAETAKTAAEQAEAGAVTAKNAAQTAQNNAETAESGAVTAKTAAESAQTAAEAARDAAQQSETNAAASATAASNSATAASTSESNAATSETNAKASEDEAEAWAEKPEDVEVEPGKFSALHHAAKAKDSEDAVAGIMNFTDGNVYQGNGAGIGALSREEFGRQNELFQKSLLIASGFDPDKVWFWHAGNFGAATAYSGQALSDLSTIGRGISWSDNPNSGKIFNSGFVSKISFNDGGTDNRLIRFFIYIDDQNYLAVRAGRQTTDIIQVLTGVSTVLALVTTLGLTVTSRLTNQFAIYFNSNNFNISINDLTGKNTLLKSEYDSAFSHTSINNIGFNQILSASIISI